MGRRWHLAMLTAAALLLPVGTAHATFHLEKVNEVLLASAGGDHAVQFVELLDMGGTEEAFTPAFAPYKLVVYDGAGHEVGEQVLDPNGLRAAASAGTEYLISTSGADMAFGVTGDERLTVPLPASAAQVCFAGSPGNVSCLSYGAISKPVDMNSQGTGAVHGPVPGDGLSDQRQPDGSVKAATPTPKAKNRADVASAPAQPPAFAGVRLATRTARVDRNGRFRLAVRCPATAQSTCSGTIRVTWHGHSWSRRSFTAPAGSTARLPMRLGPAASSRVRRGHGIRVAVTIAATAAGSRRAVTRGTATLLR